LDDFQPFVWTPLISTNTIPPARGGHTLTILGETLILFGGCYLDINCFDDLFFFDLRSKEWSKPKVYGEQPSPRNAHSATLHGASLYIFGGSG